MAPESTHRGSSGVSFVDPPIISPHISGKVVSLSLSDNEKTLVLTEVQRLEAVSLVAHMEGLRPNRPELRRMLYAIFPEEVNNVVDIQFMGKGCYHLEFSDHLSVGRLLEIKHTSLEGAWISFYKWNHNVSVDDILKNKEAHMIFTAIFPGLKKEWRQVLTQIGSLLGTVIAIKNDSSQDDDRIRGAPSLRILAPRNSELPSYVLLPNLQEHKEPLSQKIMYQGLPDQCFICRNFGHLGKECPRRRDRSEEVLKSTSKVGKSDWTPVATKHSFKQPSSSVNSMFLLDCNPYNPLNSEEGSDISLKNNLRKANTVTEVQSPSSSKQVQEVLPFKEFNDTVGLTSEHKLEVFSMGQVKGNQLGDKGKHIIHSLSHPMSQDKGRKIDCSGNDMDCDNPLSLVIYEDDTSKQNSLSVLEKKSPQSTNDCCFSAISLGVGDNSTLEKVIPVRSHKYSGKEMMITRRQLRVAEEGKRRGLVLAEKRIVS